MRTLGIFAIILISLTACSRGGMATTDNALRFHPGAESGQWTVINYWAVWCKPCRDEIPELNEFAEHHGKAVQVLGVNYDARQGDALRKDMAELGIHFPVLLQDPGPALGLERPKGLPFTVIIDPQGQVRDVLLGPQTGPALTAKTVERDHE